MSRPAQDPLGSLWSARSISAIVAVVVLLVGAFVAGRLTAGPSAPLAATATRVAETPGTTPLANAPVALATSTAAPSVALATEPPATGTPSLSTSLASPSPSAVAALDLRTICAIAPVRGFGTLYTSQPAVAGRLGCPLAPERAVDLVSQTFKDGRLLWRSDQNQVVVLFTTQRWFTTSRETLGTPAATSATGTPVSRFAAILDAPSELSQRLGAATSSDQSMAGAVQDFKNGLLIWTADHIIFALYSDGSLGQYADTFRDATPTPAATLAAAASSAAGATPSPRPPAAAPSPAVAGCGLQPIRGFGLIYQQNPAVAARLGCAIAAESGIQITRETFDSGLMLWPGGVGSMLVLRRDGSWAGYPNTWQAGAPLADVGPPPAGHVAPTGSFGQLWRQQPSVRPGLGWATTADQLVSGAEENFAKGQMLWTDDHTIYVLFGDGTYQSFVDTFVG